MARDKQLGNVTLEQVTKKRQLGQVLNAKEFAVLAGISYSAAREWFRLPGFPVFRGFVFWQDFCDWRRAQFQLQAASIQSMVDTKDRNRGQSHTRVEGLPPKAARLLLDNMP